MQGNLLCSLESTQPQPRIATLRMKVLQSSALRESVVATIPGHEADPV